jgi:hypothetical protein
MYIVIAAWMYVVLMVAVVEAVGAGGSLLGAAMTVLWWGVVPLTIVGYLWRTPARKAARRAERQSNAAGVAPDRSSHAPGDAVAPEREEP